MKPLDPGQIGFRFGQLLLQPLQGVPAAVGQNIQDRLQVADDLSLPAERLADPVPPEMASGGDDLAADAESPGRSQRIDENLGRKRVALVRLTTGLLHGLLYPIELPRQPQLLARKQL